ncbi:MAG: thioredoxin domain-containing protein, partial [bacterium]|nr:thioredoxin domain-containing protein [bacterium]
MTRHPSVGLISLTAGASALILILSLGLPKAQEVENMPTTETKHRYTNHLVNENSPYLLSHAHNPVNWYPWGDEALTKAREENKPIFLSIGYAACHWCHVMERESFENEEIADILNEHYVSIKVDREQRPDLDQIYMTFTTAITGGGGWPMTVFLTPDLKPFFAGTYFPPDDKYGRPGFGRLITEVANAWQTEREKILNSSERILSQISAQVNQKMGQSLLGASMLDRGAEGLMQGFDQTHGGFGNAPKFPHATELSFFLRYYRRSGDLTYLQAANKALKGMAQGGIYDQIGGGFARYSVDEKWLVPHFEKMLYDNGLLAQLYAEAYQMTGDKMYLETLKGTLDFILREMTHETGGFYSALDADSEGEEGKFYVWSKDEMYSILGEDADLFCRFYNVTEGGNFEGHNILNLNALSERVESEYKRDDFDGHMAALRRKLFDARAERV